MTKLNVLINKKTGEKESKQQDTILMENDFIETLKEHEAKSIAMQVRSYVILKLYARSRVSSQPCFKSKFTVEIRNLLI